MKSKLFIADLRSHCSNGISTGHFFPVAAMYQQLLKERCDVVVAGGPVYKNRFKDDELLLLPHNVSGTTLKDKWHTMKNAIKLFKEAKGQTIVIQQGTVVTAFIAIALFYHRTSKLFMIQYSNEGVRSFIKRVLYKFAKSKIDGMICPSDEIGCAYGIPYCVVPDYIYTGSVEKVKLSGDELGLKKYDFCMVGRIAEEKGIVEAASFFARTKYKVVIAGKTQNAELDAKLRRACENASNIDLRIGYISEAEYQDLLENSKYTILNYQGEYSRRSSGVVYDTLFAGVPVIGQQCLALNFIKDFKIGYLYNKIQDLSEKNLDDLLNDQTILLYKKHIIDYCQLHKSYKRKIASFVFNDNEKKL
jgi:glycosyltransferase involved in cell wall biosynthesis